MAYKVHGKYGVKTVKNKDELIAELAHMVYLAGNPVKVVWSDGDSIEYTDDDGNKAVGA